MQLESALTSVHGNGRALLYGLFTLSRMNRFGLPAVGTLKVCVLPLPVSVMLFQLPTERLALHSAR